jgi:hypothetical protein
MALRRTDREIVDRKVLDDIIARCSVCRLGLVVDGRPYVVPLCFGYDGNAVFAHMANAGKKIEGLREGNKVCIEFDIPGDVIRPPNPCGWSMSYESVIVYGSAEFLESAEEKKFALMTIMSQYGGDTRDWSFPATVLDNTLVLKVSVDEITGKATRAQEPADK